MSDRKRHERYDKLKRRYEAHWQRVLYMQLAAYAVVALLWPVPIPNPIKLLAITFHELSHGLAAILTGGRVFGFAIDPGGAGITMGIGGNILIIVFAGYLGSAVWGTVLYVVSVRWRPNAAVFALELLIIASTLLGWLNAYTIVFGVGSLVLMTMLFPMHSMIKQFFVQMTGSACCLFAPLDILGNFIGSGSGPRVKGTVSASDIAQLATITGIHAVVIGVVLISAQVAWLIVLVRWTCHHGARQYLQDDMAEAKARMVIKRDLHPEKRVYKLK